ncbi:unnamed protein product [Aphanomyces euteiches]
MADGALSFVKEGCSCNRPIFDLKYLRTHRAGSVKLIRCFPHCCPNHSYANFCTSSIGLKARLVGNDITENDRAYLRFQPTMDHVYQRGEEIDASVVLENARSADNLKGEWIPSESVHTDATMPQDLVYRFNHVNSVGWHYGWMGTSTKAHRTCTHHLVAYILRQVVRDNRIVCQVRAVLTSSPFIVMSYRRACYKCQKHRDNDDSALCECEGEFNVSQGQLSLTPASSPSAVPTPPPQPSPETSIERELLSIHLFLQYTPAALFADFFSVLEAQLVDNILIPARVSAPASPLLPQLLRPSYQRPTMTPEMQSLLACLVDCVALTFKLAQQNRQNFSHYAAFLFDRKALNESFTHWLHSQYELLNDHVGRTFHTSISSIALQIRQSSWQFDELLQHHPSTFEYYVAQLREVYLGTKNPIPPTLPSQVSAITGQWTYGETAGLSWGQTEPSILSVLRWISMLYALELNFTGSALLVRSKLQMYNTISSEFVLDGMPRVFRVFPNGESTMSNISGFFHGDYVGSLVGNQDEIELHLFGWPLVEAFAYVSRCRIKPQAGRLLLEIQVCQAPVEPSLDWSTMTSEERCGHFVRESEAVVLATSFLYWPIK